MKQFSLRINPELLTHIKLLAVMDGRRYNALIEDALQDYINKRVKEKQTNNDNAATAITG